MKKIGYIVLAVIGFTACENKLETPVDFHASLVENEAVTMGEDSVYRAQVGTSVQFLLDGNADFISMSYSIFNETSATMNLDCKLSWADNQDNLRLFLSTDFAGLGMTDAKADSTLIRDHQWVDLTDSIIWPQTKNEETNSKVNLSAWKGQKVVLAYQYVTRDNSGFQPMFTLSNMEIRNVVNKNGELASVTAATNMGFQPFDMLNMVPDEQAYQTGTAAGMWDVTFADDKDKTAIKIRQTAKGNALNEDWLVSRSFLIPRGKEDGKSGISVKNIYLDVKYYPFTFDEYGEYTITFYAANANYLHSSNVSQTFKFIIYE